MLWHCLLILFNTQRKGCSRYKESNLQDFLSITSFITGATFIEILARAIYSALLVLRAIMAYVNPSQKMYKLSGHYDVLLFESACKVSHCTMLKIFVWLDSELDANELEISYTSLPLSDLHKSLLCKWLTDAQHTSCWVSLSKVVELKMTNWHFKLNLFSSKKYFMLWCMNVFWWRYWC